VAGYVNDPVTSQPATSNFSKLAVLFSRFFTYTFPMPRHPATTDESLELVKPPAKESNAQEISEKLDVLIMHISRMDQRDKIRMWGSFFRAMLGIIPMLFFLWSIWYFATHTDEIIRKV